MAVTLAAVKKISLDNARMSYFTVTGPASYTTGGETLTIAQQRQVMNEVCGSAVDFDKVTFFGSARNASGYVCALDKTNDKMLFFDADSEASGDLSLQVVDCFVIYDVTNG
jgi:hypothetical protein